LPNFTVCEDEHPQHSTQEAIKITDRNTPMVLFIVIPPKFHPYSKQRGSLTHGNYTILLKEFEKYLVEDKHKQKCLPNLADPLWWEEVVPNAKASEPINSRAFGFSSRQNKLNLPRIYHKFTSFFKRE
jgi:hypothetical protein